MDWYGILVDWRFQVVGAGIVLLFVGFMIFSRWSARRAEEALRAGNEDTGVLTDLAPPAGIIAQSEAERMREQEHAAEQQTIVVSSRRLPYRLVELVASRVRSPVPVVDAPALLDVTWSAEPPTHVLMQRSNDDALAEVSRRAQEELDKIKEFRQKQAEEFDRMLREFEDGMRVLSGGE